MKKNYSLILIALLCAVLSGYGQGSETLTNLNASASSYVDGSYTGDNGVTWSYTTARTVTATDNITGTSIGFGRPGNGPVRSLSATSNANGVGDLSYTVSSYFTGGTAADRTIEVHVNGTLYDTYTLAAEGPDYSRTVTVNESGAVLIEFLSVGTRQMVLDDISWTAAAVTDPNLAISGTTNHGNSCLTTAASTVQYTISNSGILPAAGINVSSDDAQFVVSNLSSTAIAASGSATFDVTFTPTALGVQTATISVTSTTPTSNSPTINITGTGISAPTISTQPTNQNEVIPNTATFSVTAANAVSYQWEVNSGSGWGNVSGGTGATTDTYTTAATSAVMDGNQYRCVVTNACGSTTSNPATLTLSNSSPNNAQSLSGCFEDTSVILTWNNPATPPTGGYVIFAIAGTTDPTSPPNDADTYTANSDFSAAPFETPASLGKVVYKGNGTTATVTGLTEGTTYSFRIFAYNGGTLTGWSNGTSGGSNLEGLAQGDIRNFTATPLTNQVTLNWLNPLPTSCFDDILIVANEGPVVFTPTGDGSAYTANSNYTGPNQVVYKGSGNTVAVTGLTNGTSYCFRAFIVRGTTWTGGVEVCAVPSLTYCTSEGDGGDGYFTLINNVSFNTIDNPSPITTDNAYSDFTSISTDVVLGETYNLEVRVETDGAFTTTARAWIDWNNNGSFEASEQYELGNAYDVIDGATDGSPLAIEVPTNAVIAATRMRISNRYGTNAPTSCLTPFDGEVEDYTINVIQPATAEMNIKGNNITIPNGFNDAANGGLNQTLFASTNVGANGPVKIYTIENIGATTLNLTGAPRVQLAGAHPGDFTVTVQPGATVGSLATSEFRIRFDPTADGVRTAIVTIQNSDSDENPYTFAIQGTAVCSTTLISSIWPNQGPENTEVTITSANDLTGATATINGLPMTTVSSSATELVVLVPSGASSGNIAVQFSTGCSSTNSFTVIDTAISGCDTTNANTLSELFISEITDAETGSSSYVEIYNGTPNTVNLSDYAVNVYNNGNTSPSSSNALSGNLASGGVYVITIGTTSCSPLNNLSVTPDQTFGSSSGINFNTDSSDAISLYKISTDTDVDIFGLYESDNWANGLGIGVDGVNFRRRNDTSPLPNPTEHHFDINEWDIIDWTNCGDSDYVDIGQFDFSTGVPPTVSVLNSPTFSCTTTVQLSVTGTEGVSGNQGLTYQWYYLVPSANAFVVVPNTADFNNVSTNATLDIVNPLSYVDYQFYCQVREDNATCYVASNAVKLSAITTIWDGSDWTNFTAPTEDDIAIIDGTYDTAVDGDIDACQLIVNSGTGRILNIANSTYVRVVNDLTVNGNVIVKTDGAFVQDNDLAIVDGDVLTTRDKISVEKETAPLATYQEYTYWSAPVEGELISNGLNEADPLRIFWFNAENYRDSTQETNNDDAAVPGQDDIDDMAPFDWQPAAQSSTMLPGVGYAATHNSIGFTPSQYIYIFEGPFNNGIIEVDLYRNDAEMADTNWNFIGNPYPSAIDADEFLNTHTYDATTNPTGVINGAIFFWSHNTAADGNTNGNEVLNYSQSDYAVINGTGETAGGDGLPVDRFIPSGQGFFVSMHNSASSTVSSGSIRTTPIAFNNSMRVTGNNTQFFRNDNSSGPNKIRLNLTTESGVFNQILIGYVNGATDADDGMYFDAHKNLSANANSIIYSLLDTPESKKFAIQGKDPSNLDLDEIIPLGFYTSIEEATLYTIEIADLEGAFMTQNTVYLKDKLLGIVHNLSENNYTFTSETGEFNDRFDIVFQAEALSVTENEASSNDLSITELGDSDVEFSVGQGFVIKQVEIIDVVGRTIYKLKGNNSTEVFNLSRLSQAAYIAKVTLSNGQVITKKAVKRH
ncbi:GEVED domain-containing protein [Psychroserpens algicola]|uniref:Choice-of-anchor D domain-containing protein n=1 Tax=Psychroserpens algicola TaxID=1719034 RepID=A0ABT0H442_9FLAO|nr:GEVED domain-containing protein [Psychroserpens algicola]MCK8479150.1 choice-of-anchor D domain-containing protein [Psychroserpens algicola]